MKLLLLTIALATVLLQGGCHTATPHPHEAERSEEFIWSEPVQFLEYHDPMVFWLSNGSKLEIVLDRDNLVGVKWNDVSAWKRGRELRLAFSAATGPILIDVETFGYIPIIGGLDSGHPLDLILNKNLENAGSTISIAQAYSINARHWETEIERLYDAAAEQPKVREVVKAAKKSWKDFSQTQFKAAGAINSLPDGTVWTIRHAQYVHTLRRAYALSLMSLMDAVTSVESLATPEETKGRCSSAAPPKPEDYPCVLLFKAKSAPVDLSSHPRARTFRTQLREQSSKPADFAGYYVAANWGCGSPCQQWALIDLRDGKVYFAPFSTAFGGSHSVNSRLFVADPPENFKEYFDDLKKAGAAPDPLEEEIFNPKYTTYWEWNEKDKKFVQIPFQHAP